MRWLLRLVVLLVVIVFVVGRYGSDFHPLISAATGVISRTQERASIPQTDRPRYLPRLWNGRRCPQPRRAGTRSSQEPVHSARAKRN